MKAFVDPALSAAVERGDLVRARQLLEAGASPESRSPRSDMGERMLHVAAHNRGIEMIALLLEYGADIEGRSGLDETPLLATMRQWSNRGEIEVVRTLLAAGANPNARRGTIDATPLHLAVICSAADAVDALLAAGADPNALAERKKLTPLRLASTARIVRALLDAGADLLASPPCISNFIDQSWAGTLAERLACIDLLIERGSPMDADGFCYLSLAAQSGHIEIVERLLAAGADPNCRDQHGSTPLSFAVRDDTTILRRLLEAGADAHEPTPLHIAAHAGYLDAVEALLAAGADPNRTDILGQRPLDLANDPRVRERLARVTAPPAAGVGRKPRRSTTKAALHTAAELGDLATLEARLVAGDDPNARSGREQVTPLHLAATAEIIARLVAAGADPLARDRGDQTPLHTALALADHLRHEELLARIEALLAAGVPVDARDCHRFTALSLAIDAGIPAVVARLLGAGANVEHVGIDEAPLVVRAALAAHESRRVEILQLLLDRSADVRRRYGGRTLLHDLALHGPIAAIALVRAAGADTEARDDSGLRPRDWAQEPALKAALEKARPAR